MKNITLFLIMFFGLGFIGCVGDFEIDLNEPSDYDLPETVVISGHLINKSTQEAIVGEVVKVKYNDASGLGYAYGETGTTGYFQIRATAGRAEFVQPSENLKNNYIMDVEDNNSSFLLNENGLEVVPHYTNLDFYIVLTPK